MDRKILIVENEGNIAGKIKDRLAGRGFEIAIACNGEEGLWKSVTEIPDAVVLDAWLPYSSGWDTCAEIKSNPETKNIPVIICTQQADANDLAKSYLMRSDACLSKPIDPNECIALIKRLIQRDAGRAS